MKLIIASLLTFSAAIAVHIGLDSRKESPALYFNGNINKENVDKFIDDTNKLRIGRFHLHINSAGGDPVEGMRLGDFILDKDVTLHVSKICHSACSQYIIPSADTTIIEDSASVLFHNSPSLLFLPEGSGNLIRRRLNDLIEKERNFFIRRGLDYELWKKMASSIEPVCWFENFQYEEDEFSRYGYLHRYSTFIVQLDVLQFMRFGNIQGRWPTSSQEAKALAQKNGFRSSLTVKFISSFSPKPSPPPSYPPCMRNYP